MSPTEGLKEWVRGLVMLLLLAASLELLVPLGSMRKYVRMTMGLLVVMAVARPIAGWVSNPGPLPELPAIPATQGLPSLEQVMADASRFRERSRQLAEGELSTLLEAQGRDAARGVPGVAEARVQVQVRVQGGRQEIAGVTVTLPAVGSGQGVRPVRPVGSEEAALAPQELTGPLAEAVRSAVAERLGLTAVRERIRVLQGPGGAE